MRAYPAVSRDILTLKNTRRKLNMSTSKRVRFLALGAVIAGLYAVLTYVAVSYTHLDMCKAVDKRMGLSEIRLLEKHGGKSGDLCFEEAR